MVSLIVAVAENNAIGKNNDLLWHLPNDLMFFKQKTLGHFVIMGRKNFESIPEKYRPLPNRQNVILTKNKNLKLEGCVISHSIEDALLLAKNNNDEEPFIIGGGQIYKEALEKGLIDKMYITHVMQSFDADTFFPEINKNQWKVVEEHFHPSDQKHDFPFLIKTYVKND